MKGRIDNPRNTFSAIGSLLIAALLCTHAAPTLALGTADTVPISVIHNRIGMTQ